VSLDLTFPVKRDPRVPSGVVILRDATGVDRVVASAAELGMRPGGPGYSAEIHDEEMTAVLAKAGLPSDGKLITQAAVRLAADGVRKAQGVGITPGLQPSPTLDASRVIAPVFDEDAMREEVVKMARDLVPDHGVKALNRHQRRARARRLRRKG